MMNLTTWAIVGAILCAYELCRIAFWIDEPRHK